MKNILFVASEGVPFIKTGGLADVIGSLPKCIDREYFDIRVILPKYTCMKQEMKDKLTYKTHFYMDFHWKEEYVGILEAEVEGVKYYFIDNEGFFGGFKPYGDNALFVREAVIHLADAVLTCRYVLCPENGLKVPGAYNQHITGLTLGGQVLEVNQDTVKVLLCVDESQDTATAYAFPYITPYSAEDHTGLYLMPEVGDVVNIQFPTEDESLAVALSSYRQAQSDRTGDPNVKYLRTPHDKEIKISEEEILITAKTGGLYIRLNQDDGIEVFSQHGIMVNTLSSIDMTAAGHISLAAGTNILMNAGAGCTVSAGKRIDARAGDGVDVSAGGELTLFSGKEMTFTATEKLGMETEKEFVAKSEEDMTVVSQKKMTLSSKEDMSHASDKKMKISAKSEVGISCKSSSIKMNGAMDLKASTIKEN